jgi:hypothetical protein
MNSVNPVNCIFEMANFIDNQTDLQSYFNYYDFYAPREYEYDDNLKQFNIDPLLFIGGGSAQAKPYTVLPSSFTTNLSFYEIHDLLKKYYYSTLVQINIYRHEIPDTHIIEIQRNHTCDDPFISKNIFETIKRDIYEYENLIHVIDCDLVKLLGLLEL